jgi:hypothetical protein
MNYSENDLKLISVLLVQMACLIVLLIKQIIENNTIMVIIMTIIITIFPLGADFIWKTHKRLSQVNITKQEGRVALLENTTLSDDSISIIIEYHEN